MTREEAILLAVKKFFALKEGANQLLGDTSTPRAAQERKEEKAVPKAEKYEELSFDAKKTLDACLLINKDGGYIEELARKHGGKITQGKWLEEVKNNMRQGGELVESVAVGFFKTNIPEKLKKCRGRPRKQQA